MGDFKKPQLKGIEDLNDQKYSNANLARKEWSDEWHSSKYGQEASSRGGKKTQELYKEIGHPWDTEEFAKIRSEQGKRQGDINALTGHIQEIQKIGASLGGSANTEAQQAARKKQIAEHFAPAGNKAAKEAKIKRFKGYAKQLYDAMDDNVLYNIKEAQSIIDGLNLPHKMSARSALKKYEYLFECTKIKGKFYYKKV